MKLQEQGKLHVGDSMSTHLPQYGFPSPITLRMLLTHTSGLANYTSFSQFPEWSVNGVPEATVLTAVSQAPLQYTPGTAYSYSNSNYFALGAIIEGVTGQSYESNLDQVLAAGEVSGDRCWQLPLWKVYGEQIKTAMADVRNTGGRPAGAITAALFLKEFVGDVPWVHLDIAGTAWLDESKPFLAKGPSGVAVLTFTRLALDW